MAFVENFDAAEAPPTEFSQQMSLTNPTTLLLSSPELTLLLSATTT